MIFQRRLDFVRRVISGRIKPDGMAMLSTQLPILIARVAVLAFISWTPLLDGTGITFTNPVTVVQADPHHQGTLLAGTAAALLFRSRDGADSWRPLPFPAALRATLHAVLIDPVKPHTYLVAVSSETPLYAGVFRSVDEGATWEQLSGLSQKQVWSLTSWAGDGRVIAAGAQDGVFISRDGGETWTPTSTQGSGGPRPVVSLAFDPANSAILYAGTPHLAWKTTQRRRLLARHSQRDGGGLRYIFDRCGRRQSETFVCGRLQWHLP